jgi:autotransporter-associated beta strand protein
MHVRLLRLAPAALLAGSTFFASPLHAGTHTWTGGTSSLWSNAGNWTGGAPTAVETSVVLTFPPGASNKTNTNDIPGLAVDTLNIDDGGYSISGDAISLKLALGTANTFTSGLSDVMLDIALTQPTVVLLNGAGVIELFGVVSGGPGAPIGITGPGNLDLRGANTFQGTVSVSGSTLYASDHDGALGASTGGCSVAS